MAMKSLRSNVEKTSERIRNKLYKELWSPIYVNFARNEFGHIKTVNTTRLLRMVLEFSYKIKRLMGKFRIRWFVQALKETRKSENF